DHLVLEISSLGLHLKNTMQDREDVSFAMQDLTHAVHQQVRRSGIALPGLKLVGEFWSNDRHSSREESAGKAPDFLLGVGMLIGAQLDAFDPADRHLSSRVTEWKARMQKIS